MLGRKTKRAPAMRLHLLDADGHPLRTLALAELKLPEDVVLELSELYFSDPEPCHIHRAAVHKRAAMELVERCPAGERVPIASLTALQQRCFSGEAAFLCIEEDAP